MISIETTITGEKNNSLVDAFYNYKYGVALFDGLSKVLGFGDWRNKPSIFLLLQPKQALKFRTDHIGVNVVVGIEDIDIGYDVVTVLSTVMTNVLLPAVRKAVSDWQQAHPDVSVQIRCAVRAERQPIFTCVRVLDLVKKSASE